MTKFIIPSLLTLAFSQAGWSQIILKSAQITLKNTPYSMDVQIEKNQQGAAMTSKLALVSYGDPEIAGHGFYSCEETLTIQGDVKMTYTLKNVSGQVIGRETVAPALQARKSVTANADSVCQNLFPTRVGAEFSKADDFVNFKTAEGVLSVSANFSAYVISDESFTASVDQNSLVQLRTFLNNTNGKNAPLTDLSTPPVVIENPDCSADPYHCD